MFFVGPELILYFFSSRTSIPPPSKEADAQQAHRKLYPEVVI
jgi:hypothetical protein